MGVPDRWADYSPYGGVIKGTRFLPFKVPLKQNLCHFLSEEQRFSIPTFIEKLTSQGLKLGLVIDLTNTRRYYFKGDFEDRGVLYAKIFTEGHIVPSDKVYGKFFGIVQKFLDLHGDDDALIGVHCTHGVNRTGQLLCRYLIEKLRMRPEEALEAFKEARGYPIERELYISDLKQRQPGAADPAVDWRQEEFQAWDVAPFGQEPEPQGKSRHKKKGWQKREEREDATSRRWREEGRDVAGQLQPYPFPPHQNHLAHSARFLWDFPGRNAHQTQWPQEAGGVFTAPAAASYRGCHSDWNRPPRSYSQQGSWPSHHHVDHRQPGRQQSNPSLPDRGPPDYGHSTRQPSWDGGSAWQPSYNRQSRSADFSHRQPSQSSRHWDRNVDRTTLPRSTQNGFTSRGSGGRGGGFQRDARFDPRN